MISIAEVKEISQPDSLNRKTVVESQAIKLIPTFPVTKNSERLFLT